MKNSSTIILSAVLSIIITFVFFQTAIPAYYKSRPNNSSFTPLTTASDQTLSGEQLRALRDELINIIQKENPRVALEQLKEKMDKDPRVMTSCHELLHMMGRAAYQKYNDYEKAILYKDEFCVSGYIHGVIESYFSNNKNIFSQNEIKNLCNKNKTGSYQRWECFHGIGHGFMFYSNNDVSFSLKSCDTLGENSDASACHHGVYMENFNSDGGSHTSKYVSFSDPFYSCKKFKQSQASCYANAPIYFLNYREGDYEGVIKWCEQAHASYLQQSCYEGASGQITRRNFKNPKSIEQFCLKLNKDKVDSCLRGIVSWYIGYYQELESVKKLCQQMNRENQNLCYQTIKDYGPMFQ